MSIEDFPGLGIFRHSIMIFRYHTRKRFPTRKLPIALCMPQLLGLLHCRMDCFDVETFEQRNEFEIDSDECAENGGLRWCLNAIIDLVLPHIGYRLFRSAFGFSG